MNSFIERFKNHSIHSSLEALLNGCERLRIERPGDPNLSSTDNIVLARSTFARLIYTARFVASAIKRANPVMWTPATLKALNSSVTTLTAAIEQYEANRDVQAFFTASDTAIDHLRPALWHLGAMSNEEQVAAFEDYCKRAEAGLSSIFDSQASIKTKELEISEAKEAFAQRLTELGVQLEAFKTQFEQQKTRVDELITGQQQAFQSSQAERVTAFTQETENRKLLLENWIELGSTSMKDLFAKFSNDSEANTEIMEKHLARAQEILGIVAASGVSGHYKETAERDFKSANTYRRWAFIFFVIMAGVIAYVVTSIKSDNFRWEMGLFRVGVGMALLIPAYYCAKESSKHREAEKRNRRLQIELATIEPYLEKLGSPDEMKTILKEKANSYFMGQVPREPDDDVDRRLTEKEWKRREELLLETLKAAGSVAKK